MVKRRNCRWEDIEWLQSQNMSTSLKAIGEMEIRQFILYVQSRPGLKGEVSTHTANDRVRALRAFSDWLNQKGYTKDHVLKDAQSLTGRLVLHRAFGETWGF